MNLSPQSLVHDQAFTHAVTTPASPAAMCGEHTLSYRDLAARATALARRLATVGVGPDDVVGLSCQRSLTGLVGMFGILACGGAYLYLDPALPAARIRYMLDEAATRVVVTDDDRRMLAGRPTVRAHRARPGLFNPDIPRPRPARPSNLAYVVYTSGSTGFPKGVAVEHGGVTNMVHQLATLFDVVAGTRVLQCASWSWDAAACEVLMTLAAGGTVVIAADEIRADPAAVAGLIRTRRVEVVTLTPSVLTLIPPGHTMPTLRTVVAVGETCPPQVVDRWAAPGRRVFNGYGPTEATVAVAVGECRPGKEVHVGVPLPGVGVRIVDAAGRTVRPGEVGELHITGTGLARGYLTGGPADAGGPAVTDGGRFHRDETGIRWFRTGDRVRQRHDGTLVHLGRIDDQIQVRGQRLELGEVESTLRRDREVSQCAVTVRAGRLVAYVVPAVTADPAELVARLDEAARAWLPVALVPHLVLLAALPLTANGKVDRKGLPDPGVLERCVTVPDLPSLPDPRNEPASSGQPEGSNRPDPKLLADVLAVLRPVIGPAGPHDNLFDLGGHSLLAAEISVALSARFGIDLPAMTVVAHPTAAQLADVVGAGSAPMKAR